MHYRTKRKRLTTITGYRLRDKYGQKERDRLLKDQEFLCAICRKNKKLEIDHDHATHRIRGLLCHKCNVKVGAFERSEANARDCTRFDSNAHAMTWYLTKARIEWMQAID